MLEDSKTINYLYDLENKPAYKSTIWTKGSSKNFKIRAILIDWLILLCNSYNINKKTLTLAVYIMDAYYSFTKKYENAKKEIQKGGLCCLKIAIEVTDTVMLRFEDLSELATTYTEKEFIECVEDILRVTGGIIIRPIPQLFFEDESDIVDDLVCLSLFSTTLTSQKPSLISKTIKYLIQGDIGFIDDMNSICKDLMDSIKFDKIKVPNYKNIVESVKKYTYTNICPNLLSFWETKNIELPDIKELPIIRDYKKMKSVGSGVSGDVYKIKRGEDTLVVKYNKLMFIEEIAILTLLSDCKYIVKLQGFLPENRGCFTFFEIGSYNLLFHIVQEELTTEDKILSCFTDVLNGLKECHYNDVIHEDIKPENVVFFPNEKRWKLIDFGLSNAMSLHRPLRNPTGSPEYRAPEIIITDGKYDNKIDIWAAGCILYIMATGKTFVNIDDYDDSTVLRYLCFMLGTPTEITWPGLNKVKNHMLDELKVYPANNDPFCWIPQTHNISRVIIENCIVMDPKKRPTAEGLLHCIQKIKMKS